MTEENWDNAKEVEPADLEPKKCPACNGWFIPKFWKERRCSFCRKNKNYPPEEMVGDQPFG